MTLDEAVKRAEEKAEEQQLLAYNLKQCKDYGNPKSTITRGVIECETCADEHRQLAEWLKDYKRLKEQEPCEDCISREAVIALIDENLDRFAHYSDYEYFLEQANRISMVTPTRKKGRWIEV